MQQAMNAIVWTGYGAPDVLQQQVVDKPTPKEGEVLVRVRVTTVTAGDCELRGLKLPLWLHLLLRGYAGWQRPHRITILGQELAGEIEAVGDAVTRFKPGDRVYGTTGTHFGSYAQYVCLPETAVLVHIPDTISPLDAVCLPVGGIEAWHFLQQANLTPGQSLLINGAGGSIGTLAVQLARRLGAEVTAVDSAEKLPLLRSIGADHVLDYACEDALSGRTYNAVLDIVGSLAYDRAVGALTDHGVFLIANPRLSHLIRRRWTELTTGKRVVCWEERSGQAEVRWLQELGAMVAAGEIKPVIDRCYPLDRTADAHRYVEAGRKQGSVVIVVAGDWQPLCHSTPS